MKFYITKQLQEEQGLATTVWGVASFVNNEFETEDLSIINRLKDLGYPYIEELDKIDELEPDPEWEDGPDLPTHEEVMEKAAEVVKKLSYSPKEVEAVFDEDEAEVNIDGIPAFAKVDEEIFGQEVFNKRTLMRLNKQSLVDMCKDHNLDSSGTKRQLIARICPNG